MHGLRVQLEGCWLHLRPAIVSQIAHLHVETRVQVPDCSVRIEPRVQYARCSSFDPEIAEQFFKIKVLRLNCGEHFARRRNCPSVRSKISPLQRERDVSRCKPRLPLIKLDPGYLERPPLCLRDCLKIRVSAGKKDDRHVETVGRIGRIDIRPKRLRNWWEHIANSWRFWNVASNPEPPPKISCNRLLPAVWNGERAYRMKK